MIISNTLRGGNLCPKAKKLANFDKFEKDLGTLSPLIFLKWAYIANLKVK